MENAQAEPQAPEAQPQEPKFQDFVDVSAINEQKVIINNDRTVALYKRLKRDPEGSLERFELGESWQGTLKKKVLERQALSFAVMLTERHAYSVDNALLANTIWYLRQAGFMGAGNLTAYYFKKAAPIIVQGDGCYLVFAPRIE